MARRLTLLTVLLVVGLAVPGWAHLPLGIGALETSVGNPIDVADPNVSQVVYFEATPEQPRVWLRFEAEAGDPLFLQLAVPVIDRYADLRPAMAFFGPGMAPVSVPFEAPETEGGMLFETAGVTPGTYHEEFTGTDLWQWEGERFDAPATGTYYLVGYLPDADAGKFMVTLGVKEQYSLSDIFDLPRILVDVRGFHEVDGLGGIVFYVLIGLAGALVVFLWMLFFR